MQLLRDWNPKMAMGYFVYLLFVFYGKETFSLRPFNEIVLENGGNVVRRLTS